MLWLTEDIWDWWCRVRDERLTRATLRTHMDGPRRRLSASLGHRGAFGRAGTAPLCLRLVAWERAL